MLHHVIQSSPRALSIQSLVALFLRGIEVVDQLTLQRGVLKLINVGHERQGWDQLKHWITVCIG